MTHSISTTGNTTEMAQQVFFLEDRLERDYASGFISAIEYDNGRDEIFQTLGDLYGFEG
jgi:hypothetical protein